MCKEGLDVVRNAGAECFIHGVSHTIGALQSVVLGETLEAFDAELARPWSKTKRIQMVYPVGYAEPPHQRCKPDASGCD